MIFRRPQGRDRPNGRSRVICGLKPGPWAQLRPLNYVHLLMLSSHMETISPHNSPAVTEISEGGAY
jgi:hypothetical protein